VAVESVYVDAEAGPDRFLDELLAAALAAGARVFTLLPGVLARAADTVTPQPVVSIVAMVDRPLAALDLGTFVLVLADVRDPGNAGTIVRSADAAGASAVVFAGTTVDLYNPKTVRSSAGSLFHVPVAVAQTLDEALAVVALAGLGSVGTSVREGTDYTEFDWSQPFALVLGNEAAGLPVEARGRLDHETVIPMAGRAESLNVAVAASVLSFEALRQRRHGAVPEAPPPSSTMPAVSSAPTTEAEPGS